MEETDTLELVLLEEILDDDATCEWHACSTAATHILKHDAAGHLICTEHAEVVKESLRIYKVIYCVLCNNAMVDKATVETIPV